VSAVRPDAAEVIRAINAAQRPVFALDVPSGLDSDKGIALPEAVRATGTVCFVALKTGLFVGDGPDFTGSVFFDDLEVSAPAIREFEPRLERIAETEVARALPARARAAKKAISATSSSSASGAGMPGATRLCGEACLRVGAGLVTVAVAPDNVAAIAAGRPELICLPFARATDLDDAIERADVIAIGPGLGRTQWRRMRSTGFLRAIRRSSSIADALNLLSLAPRQRDNWILTPLLGRRVGCSRAPPEPSKQTGWPRLTHSFCVMAALSS